MLRSSFARTSMLALCLLLAVCAAAPAKAVANSEDPWAICGRFIAEAERALDLPAMLLRAVARVESGRLNRTEEAISAWPWTVMAEGKGRFLPTKAAAIAEVQALRSKGVTNIDVGCMQINLHFHPEAFRTLEEAFDPAQNVAYGAAFLTRLRQEARSWTKAIGRYHSKTPALSNRYRVKVFRAWRKEKHLAEAERRAARRAAREAHALKRTETAAGQILPASLTATRD